MHILDKLSTTGLHLPPVESITSPGGTELVVHLGQFAFPVVFGDAVLPVSLELNFEILQVRLLHKVDEILSTLESSVLEHEPFGHGVSFDV